MTRKGGRLRIISFALLAALIVAPVSAQDAPAEEPDFLGGFDLGLGVGATAFTDVVDGELVTTTYQKVAVSPDINVGKFGLGLDLTFHMNFSGGPTGDKYLRTEDWVPPIFADDTATFGQKLGALLELYLGKFRYISWGARGEPLYIKFGSIDDLTLGNGFIVGNYSNMLFLPEQRILGLALGLDGALFEFPLLGLEALTGNLARFDVFGTRLYVRPLVFTEIPVLKNLSVGATLALDRDPYLHGDADGDDATTLVASPVIGLGVDVQQPIVSVPLASLALFADWGFLTTTPEAGLAAAGTGAMFGLGGKLFGFLTYGAQLRLMGPRFIPVYMDGTYDLARAEKYRLLTAPEDEAAPFFAGWVASIGTSFLEDQIVFRITADGPFSSPVLDDLGVAVVDNELNWPRIKGLIKVEGDFLAGFSFLASYDKKNITTLADFISAENAVIQARINYQTGPAVISFVYNL